MESYKKHEKSAYLLGMTGQNILYALVCTVLPYFLQNVIFLPAIIVGVILTLGRLLDAVKDPFMGALLDRTHSKWGKCRPYLLFSPLPIAVFTILTFINQIYTAENTDRKNIGIICWAACTYLLWEIAFTCVDTPLWTLPLCMTAQKSDRDALLTKAKIVAAIGGGLVSTAALPRKVTVSENNAPKACPCGAFSLFQRCRAAARLPLQKQKSIRNSCSFGARQSEIEKFLAEQGENRRNTVVFRGFLTQCRRKLAVSDRIAFGYGHLMQAIGIHISGKLQSNVRGLQYGCTFTVLLLTLFGAAALQYAAIRTKERVTESKSVPTSLRQSFRDALAYRPFQKLLLSGLLRSPTTVLNTVTTTFVVYYFGNNGNTPYMQYLLLLGGGYMLGQFGGTLLVPRLTNQFTKHKLYQIGNLCGAVPFFLIFLLYCAAPAALGNALPLTVFTILMGICGIGQGLVSALQTVMIADCAESYAINYQKHLDGTFFSGLSLLNKVSAGIGSLLTATVYAAVGFEGKTIKDINDALYMGAEFKSDPQFLPFRFALLFLLCIPPAISGILALLPMIKPADKSDAI